MNIEGKKRHIDTLYYDYAMQDEDFRLAYTYHRGSVRYWSKWYNYLEVQASKKLIIKVNNRTQLKTECVIDIDPRPEEENRAFNKRHERALKIIKTLNEIKWRDYSTGSRGYHIHIYKRDIAYMTKIQREKWRSNLIMLCGGDPMKRGDNVMIALEGTPHWKTGRHKVLLETGGEWK